MVPTLMEPTLTVPTLMEPTLTVHTLTVPTLMVHLVAPNVLLNRFKEKRHDPDSNPDRSRGKPFKPFYFFYFWRLIASRNVNKRPGWNHETAIGWRSKNMLLIIL